MPAKKKTAAKRPTIAEQARELGIGERYFRELRARGMRPMRLKGESFEKWAKYARDWMAENVQQKVTAEPEDRKDPTTPAYWLFERTKAQAMRERLELSRARGSVHGLQECERGMVEILRDVVAAHQALPLRFSRELVGKSADYILERTEQLMREANEEFVQTINQRILDQRNSMERDAGSGGDLADQALPE